MSDGAHGVRPLHIQPGKPTQNAYIERFNGSYRKEVLDAYVFGSLDDVRAENERWLTICNTRRPHDSLGRVPPLTFLPRSPARVQLPTDRLRGKLTGTMHHRTGDSKAGLGRTERRSGRWYRSSRLVRVASRIALLVLIGAVATSLARTIVRDGPEALAAWSSTAIQWRWVLIATFLGFCGHAVYLVGWKRLLGDLDVAVTYSELVEYFLISTLGRYLPAGKAWQMGIVGVLASRHGRPGALVAATSLFQAVIGVAVGLLMVFSTAGSIYGIPPIWSAIPAGGLVALLLSPLLVRRSARMLAVSSRFLPGLRTIRVTTMWVLIWTAAVSWIAWGLALNALARSASPEVEVAVATYFSAWTGGFLSGLLAVITPAGVGIREEVMHRLLVSSGVVPGTALVVVAIARAWSLLVDVVPAVAVLALSPNSIGMRRQGALRNEADTNPEPERERQGEGTERAADGLGPPD